MGTKLRNFIQAHLYIFAIFLISLSVALCIWLRQNEEKYISKQTEHEGELLISVTSLRMQGFINAINRMSARLSSNIRSKDFLSWRKDASLYLDQYDGLETIVLLNNQMEVIDLVSSGDRSDLKGRNIGDYPDVRTIIEDAAYEYKYKFSDKPFPFFSGSHFFGIFPVTNLDHIEGYIIVLVDYKEWLQPLFNYSETAVQIISAGQERFYHTLKEGQSEALGIKYSNKINIGGMVWKFSFIPSVQSIKTKRTVLPWFVLLFGATMTVLIILFLYFQRELDAAKVKVFNASRLQEIADVVAGLSHEVNNPLAIVQGGIYQLQKRVEDNEIDPKHILDTVNKIDRASQRITRVVEGLRLFAKDGTQDSFVNTHVSEIFENVIALCKKRLEENGILFTVVDHTKDASLQCILGQIVRVLVSLTNNANDAIQGQNERWVKLEATDLGPIIVFTVTDSGKGIPLAIRNKLMNPFFTTKDIGKGTGLGLSMARGIARGHNGVLRLDEESANTRFVLEIPKIQSLNKTGSETKNKVA